MKIVLVIDQFDDANNGTTISARRFAAALKEHGNEVRVIATGRSDFPNQVNNVLCFPGLFKGALSVRARDINEPMKLAAAYAIADLITDAERSEEYIIPNAFDPRVAESVAAAVAKAARETGVARL